MNRCADLVTQVHLVPQCALVALCALGCFGVVSTLGPQCFQLSIYVCKSIYVPLVAQCASVPLFPEASCASVYLLSTYLYIFIYRSICLRKPICLSALSALTTLVCNNSIGALSFQRLCLFISVSSSIYILIYVP